MLFAQTEKTALKTLLLTLESSPCAPKFVEHNVDRQSKGGETVADDVRQVGPGRVTDSKYIFQSVKLFSASYSLFEDSYLMRTETASASDLIDSCYVLGDREYFFYVDHEQLHDMKL